MRARLTHNIGLKILSIVVAAVVWLLIMNVADPTITTGFSSIPVRIVNDDVITSRGYSYSVESGERIDIRVKGKSSVVGQLSEADFAAVADFRNLNDMYMVGITVECMSDHADEIDISLRTESMAIKREEQDTQPYNISVNLIGQVKEGYYCSGSKVSTPLVMVTGSVSQVSAIKDIAVNVDISGKSTTFSNKYELVAYDASGNIIDAAKLMFSDDNISVVTEILPIKHVGLEIVPIGETAPGYYVEKVEFAPASFNMAANEALLNKMSSLVVPCDISDADNNVEIQIDLNDYLNELFTESYYSTDNTKLGIVVTVKPKQEKQFEFSAEDVEIRNVSETLEGSLYALWNTTITVSGRQGTLDDVTLDSLGLYVDMKDCGMGTYSRQLLYETAGEVEVTAGSVMVKLSIKSQQSADETQAN